MIWSFKSTKEQTIRRQQKNVKTEKIQKDLLVKGKECNSNKKTTPVIHSTAGYPIDIFCPQHRHLPLRIKKLTMGILSYQATTVLQLTHEDLGRNNETLSGIL
jgi:hypothetical protein